MADSQEASPWASRRALLVSSAAALIHSIAGKPTVDGLLGASEVDGLDATGLLELGRDSSLGGSCARGSVDGRDKGALLDRSGSQLPGSVAESAGSLS